MKPGTPPRSEQATVTSEVIRQFDPTAKETLDRGGDCPHCRTQRGRVAGGRTREKWPTRDASLFAFLAYAGQIALEDLL